eukprot:Rmarinus@m.7656
MVIGQDSVVEYKYLGTQSSRQILNPSAAVVGSKLRPQSAGTTRHGAIIREKQTSFAKPTRAVPSTTSPTHNVYPGRPFASRPHSAHGSVRFGPGTRSFGRPTASNGALNGYQPPYGPNTTGYPNYGPVGRKQAGRQNSSARSENAEEPRVAWAVSDLLDASGETGLGDARRQLPRPASTTSSDAYASDRKMSCSSQDTHSARSQDVELTLATSSIKDPTDPKNTGRSTRGYPMGRRHSLDRTLQTSNSSSTPTPSGKQDSARAPNTAAAHPNGSSGNTRPSIAGGPQGGDNVGKTAESRLSVAPAKDDLIVIHVFDEARGVNKDFKCERQRLLEDMKYFSSYFSGSLSSEDIDISVHCDVTIFEWLMKYLNEKDSPPKLDASNVVSILISSDFLKMARLVEDCIQFVHEHLNEIVRLPIDLNCLNNEILTRLANLTSVESLERLHDRKDKLSSKLYLKKLEALLSNPNHILHRCGSCGQLYTLIQRSWSTCAKAKLFVAPHGNIIAEHTPSHSWSLEKYITRLREKQISWKNIYWHVWGKVKSLKCDICERRFPVCEYGHCAYHLYPPVFLNGQNVGKFPCCSASVVRFDTSISVAALNLGCRAADHVVTETDGEDLMVLDTVKKYSTNICQAFQPAAGTSEPMNAALGELSSDESEPSGFDAGDHSDASSGPGDDPLDRYVSDDEDNGADYASEDSARPNLAGSSQPAIRTRSNAGNSHLRPGRPDGSKRRRRRKRCHPSNNPSMKKHKQWKFDMQREAESNRMQRMMRQLTESSRSHNEQNDGDREKTRELMEKKGMSKYFLRRFINLVNRDKAEILKEVTQHQQQLQQQSNRPQSASAPRGGDRAGSSGRWRRG